MPLRGEDFYREHERRARLGRARRRRSTSRASASRSRTAATRPYGALVLATGAQPEPPAHPGADLPHVFTLRTLADSRAIIAKAAGARRAVVVGASFIGLEVAASLRARGLEVHVVAPGDGAARARARATRSARFVKKVHEEHGVTFHLGVDARVDRARRRSTLAGGERLEADLVVVGRRREARRGARRRRRG